MGAPGRHDGLDRLKAGVTLLVIFHHTAITYGGAGGWFYRELAQSDRPSSILLTFFCAINLASYAFKPFPQSLRALGSSHIPIATGMMICP